MKPSQLHQLKLVARFAVFLQDLPWPYFLSSHWPMSSKMAGTMFYHFCCLQKLIAKLVQMFSTYMMVNKHETYIFKQIACNL